MHLLNLLTQKKEVVGIEISDSVIRIAFFRTPKKTPRDKKNKKTASTPREQELMLIEEPIASNIIANGAVMDKDLLAKILRVLKNKIKIDVHYAIVSIPDDKIYSRLFSFPRSVHDGRMQEAMRLAIGFQLPLNIEDIRLDWEYASKSSGGNEILLSTIQKTIAQDYVDALERAGWKTLALESHLASVARAALLLPGETTLFTKKNPDGVTLFALKDGVLRFSRTLPLHFVAEEKVAAEIKKVQTALESSMKTPIVVKSLMEARIREDYAVHPALTPPQAKWLIALGAAIRGQMPEGNDKLISLLPVGTEEAYAYQKATTFVTLLRNLTIGVSIFFVLAYTGAYLFILSLSRTASNAVTALTTSPVSPDLLAKESMVTNLNLLTKATQTILSETPAWSSILEELRLRIIDGINISSFSANAPSEKMSLVGVSRDRDTLNQFKKFMQASPFFTEVEIPLTNLQQKINIPFSASFRLKDPSAVYYK